jgi:hypothetical protein
MNAFIDRPRVHEMSESIGAKALEHQASMTRLLQHQKRLVKFFEENAESMDQVSNGVGVYLLGVVIRIFDMAGGRLKKAQWSQVRATADRVLAHAGTVLPVDDGFQERVRAIERAQPHILDEALMALFDRKPREEEAELKPDESVKLFFLMWVATEVLDENWTPSAGFEGETSYTYHHIDPEEDREDEGEGETEGA